MKPEEAIDYLNDPIGKRDKHEDAINLAIEALEKQIPKEPTDFVWRTVAGQIRLCPTCRNTVSRAGRYCTNCGQRIRI